MRTNATTYQELDTLLGTRDSRKVGNNTYAERLGAGVIGIRLHGTHVVILSAHRLVLNSGGWQTVTTKDRINTYLPHPWKLVQKKGSWSLWQFVCTNGEGVCSLKQGDFYDGVTIDLGIGQHGAIVEREAVQS
jgi:hypothetical protein